LLEEGVPRRDIRHEITLDSSSSGGRVDMAVLRDSWIVGIEIKSGADKLDRLRDQCKAMRRAFDYVRIVIDTRLAPKAEASLWATYPTWYHHGAAGFVSRYQGGWIDQPRPSLSGADSWYESRRTTTPDMAALLWKEEACPISSSKTRTAALGWIRENMALKDLRPRIIDALRTRGPNRWEEAFWRDFDALEAAAA
jgi:hypothetical protein